MFCGESGFSLSSPFMSQREGDRPRRGPTPNPTITHTPGAPPRPGRGEAERVAVGLFSMFLSCCMVMLS